VPDGNFAGERGVAARFDDLGPGRPGRRPGGRRRGRRRLRLAGARGPAAGTRRPGARLLPPGTGDRSYHLADYRGSTVVVVFYPADNSPVCTQQLRSYSEDMTKFADLGAEVLCLSPQDVSSHEEFSRSHGLSLPLLADVDKRVGAAYGILGPLGFYRRSVFVIDPSASSASLGDPVVAHLHPRRAPVDAVRSTIG